MRTTAVLLLVRSSTLIWMEETRCGCSLPAPILTLDPFLCVRLMWKKLLTVPGLWQMELTGLLSQPTIILLLPTPLLLLPPPHASFA